MAAATQTCSLAQGGNLFWGPGQQIRMPIPAKAMAVGGFTFHGYRETVFAAKIGSPVRYSTFYRPACCSLDVVQFTRDTDSRLAAPGTGSANQNLQACDAPAVYYILCIVLWYPPVCCAGTDMHA